MFKPLKFIRSFSFALKGLGAAFSEQNFWIHSVATIGVIVAGFCFSVNILEGCLLLFAISMVLTAEIFNTAIELLTDKVQPEIDPVVEKIKDLSAAAVLVSAITALAIGVLVFGKHVLHLLVKV